MEIIKLLIHSDELTSNDSNSSKNTVDYKKTKKWTKVTSFCSEFAKKPSNIKFNEIQSSRKKNFFTQPTTEIH